MPRLSTKRWNRIAPITRVKYANISGPSTDGAGMWMPNGANGRAGQKREMDVMRMRALRMSLPWLGAGVDIRTEGIAQAEGTITAVDEEEKLDPSVAKRWRRRRYKGLTDAQESTVAQILDFLKCPDPSAISYNWTRLIRPAWEDALIVGRGPIRKYLDEDGILTRMRVYDGRRLVRNHKWDPDDLDLQKAQKTDGTPVMPRYYYLEVDERTGMINEQRGEPLFADEIALIEPNPVSYQDDGLAPIAYIENYLNAHEDTFASAWALQKTGQPPGIFKVPSAQAGTIQKLQDQWRQRALGRSSALFVSLPADAEWMALGDTNLSQRGTFSLIDIIVRGVAAALRISTVALGWTQTTLERNANEQGEYQDDGLINALRFTMDVFDSEILPHFRGSEGLAYRYDGVSDDDEAEGAQAISEWTGGHFVIPSIDQLCLRAGLPLPDRDEGTLLDRAYQDVWVVSGGSFLPVFMVLGLTANQMVPGYDPSKGEVDPEAARQQKADDMKANADAMAASGTHPGMLAQQGAQNGGGQSPPPFLLNGNKQPPALSDSQKQIVKDMRHALPSGAGDDDIADAIRVMSEGMADLYPGGADGRLPEGRAGSNGATRHGEQ